MFTTNSNCKSFLLKSEQVLKQTRIILKDYIPNMNFTRNKMILYMLIIATGIDFILPWPTFQRQVDSDSEQNIQSTLLQETRFSRQIVQPTWLNVGQREPPVDPTVYVDDRALEEAEEIRKEIQKAVDEDTYVVSDQQPDPNTGMEQEPSFNPPNESNPPPPPQPPMHALPNWYIQVQKLWQNWSQNLFKGFRT